MIPIKENIKIVRKNETKLNSMNEKFTKDPLKMERITNNNLICRDCRFKFDDTEKPCNTSKCAKFSLLFLIILNFYLL